MFVKKIVCTILLLTVLTMPLSFSASFNDLDNVKWAQTSISNMILNGFVGGYSDGTFKPTAKITRAEIITIINKMNGFTEESKTVFKDVSENHWAYIEISKAVKAGYVSGFSDGTFKPNDPVTREQVATILNNLYHLENTTISIPIKDLSKLSPWAVQAVVNVMANGIMSGYPDGTFGSKSQLTRAEGVVALNKIVINSIPTKEWVANNPNTAPSKPTKPTTPTTPVSPTAPITPNPGPVVADDEIVTKLKTVNNLLNTSVLPVLNTNLQRNAISVIRASISNYILDKNYSTNDDVTEAKQLVRAMSETESDYFIRVIQANIPLEELVALNDVFQLVDISQYE